MIRSTIKSGLQRGREVEFSRSDEAGLAASTSSATHFGRAAEDLARQCRLSIARLLARLERQGRATSTAACTLGSIRSARKTESSRRNAALGGARGGRPIMSGARLQAIGVCREAIGRCACHARGTWSAYILGTVRDEPTVWPGCATHRGQTAGAPVPHLAFIRAIGRIQQLSRIAALLDKE